MNSCYTCSGNLICLRLTQMPVRRKSTYFYETRGVERALIQKIVLSIKAKSITSVIDRETGQFPGTLFMLIQYLILTYGKSPPGS